MAFNGFSAEGIDLLQQNRLRDSKEFYDDHKEQIRTLVQDPFCALLEELEPTIRRIDSRIPMQPRRMLSRVRRDTRFTKDKTLYRDHMWATIGQPKAVSFSRPCFYVEISPEYWDYGCGYFNMSPSEMSVARQMILKEEKSFLKAFSVLQRNREIGFYADLFKRPKFPDAPQKYQIWLNSKELGWMVSSEDFGPVLDGSMVGILQKKLLQMKPLYDFLYAVKVRAGETEE